MSSLPIPSSSSSTNSQTSVVLFDRDDVARPTAPPVTERDPWFVAFRVLPQALGHATWALTVTWLVQTGHGRAWLLRHFGGVGTLVHGLLGGVLGLLLAFRTNQSYNRYWRATEAFGALQSALVAVARKCAYLNDGDDPADNRLYRAIVRHLIAMPVAVKHYLRRDGEDDDDDDFFSHAADDSSASYVSILQNQELADLVEARDAFGVPPPHALFASLYVLLRPIRASDDGRGGRLMIWSAALQSLDDAAGAYGVLKTIRNSRPPRSYALHVRRFLLVWLATLPLALVLATSSFNPLGAALVSGAIAWALYSTDELAHLVGQPFDRLVITPGVRPYLLWLRLRGFPAWAAGVLRTVKRRISERRKRRNNTENERAKASSEPPVLRYGLDDDDDAGRLSDAADEFEAVWPEWEDDVRPARLERLDRPPRKTLKSFAIYGSSAFPLDEWADYLVTSLRQHALVHSVLDRRIRSRSWVVQPEACVQKPPSTPTASDNVDEECEPASETTTEKGAAQTAAVVPSRGDANATTTSTRNVTTSGHSHHERSSSSSSDATGKEQREDPSDFDDDDDDDGSGAVDPDVL